MRLGIAGTGMIVDMVAPHLASWGIEVSAISGTPRSAGRIEELAETYGARGRYQDWHELVRDENVDVVYVAVPNFLHYEVSREALLAGKDVICEKPLCSNEREAEALSALARERGRFLWEAVVTPHQPNFKFLRDRMLSCVGDVRHVYVNFSQYSSRYDRFQKGDLAPVFDVNQSGGALMDLGLYTLSFTLGLFGEPREARYLAHIERGIDTSGTIVLTYDGFSAINVCAKDCDGPNEILIEGVDGYLHMDGAPNFCRAVTLQQRGTYEYVVDRSYPNVYDAEFFDYVEQWESGDLEACYAYLDQSLLVSRVMGSIRREAGIIFPADA